MEFAVKFVVVGVSSSSAHFAPVHSRARDNDLHDLFTPDEHTQERADSNRQQQSRPGVACAPIGSPIGEAYLRAMRAAINCALANRQILTVRMAFAEVFPGTKLPLLSMFHATPARSRNIS